MTVFRLTPIEEKKLVEMSSWLQVDKSYLLQRMISNQFDYLEQEKTDFDKTGDVGVQADVADLMGLFGRAEQASN